MECRARQVLEPPGARGLRRRVARVAYAATEPLRDRGGGRERIPFASRDPVGAASRGHHLP